MQRRGPAGFNDLSSVLIQLSHQPHAINSHILPFGFLFNQKPVSGNRWGRERRGKIKKGKNEKMDEITVSGFNNEPAIRTVNIRDNATVIGELSMS